MTKTIDSYAKIKSAVQAIIGRDQLPAKGDLLIDSTYIFEVGGKSKGYGQIADIPKSYVIADGIDVGFGNKIPLWLFGFLY